MKAKKDQDYNVLWVIASTVFFLLIAISARPIGAGIVNFFKQDEDVTVLRNSYMDECEREVDKIFKLKKEDIKGYYFCNCMQSSGTTDLTQKGWEGLLGQYRTGTVTQAAREQQDKQLTECAQNSELIT